MRMGMWLYWTGNVGGWVQLYREVLPSIVRWHNRGRMFGLRCLLPIGNGTTTKRRTNQPKSIIFFCKIIYFKGAMLEKSHISQDLRFVLYSFFIFLNRFGGWGTCAHIHYTLLTFQTHLLITHVERNQFIIYM